MGRDSSTTASVASWLPPCVRTPLKSLLVQSLCLGPLPRHVAFIMDGNRRWAKPKGLRPTRGHVEGFEALKGLLGFLMDLKIAQVTVYAFAIDNFKRSEEEVETLMELAKTKLLELASHGELLHQHGVRVFVVGRRDLLPRDVLDAIKKVEEITQHNTNAILNVCVSYSSQDEMAHAVRQTVDDAIHHRKDTTVRAIESNLYTSQNPQWCDPELLIRTSSVSRLSDFLLWQINEATAIHVLPCYWPDIGVADVVPVLLTWQANRVIRSLFGHV